MGWDTEGTKRKILDAATTEFATRGPDGTTIERIAKLAGVNKERVYNYFGSKSALFARVLREQLSVVAETVPFDSSTAADLGEYAGRLYDYHRDHPQLVRLLLWEGLTYADEVPEEALRRESYRLKTSAFEAGQAAGTIDDKLPADVLNFLLIALAGYWAAMPQVARMITGARDDNDNEIGRRRSGVVEAAHRLSAQLVAR